MTNSSNGRSAILILIDGLGIGPRNPAVNPLAAFQPRVLQIYRDGLGPLPRDGRAVQTDVQLGVAGRPQSATNHTALLTGVNAPRMIGRHLSGFPSPRLKTVLAERSLFKRLRERGASTAFANTYRDEFFTNRPRWVSATTVMCETSGTPLFRMPDLAAGRSLHYDFTNRLAREQGWEVPLRTPGEAAAILAALAEDHHLVLYEYFLTDLTGHRGTMAEAVALLESLDEFLGELVEALPRQTSLVVTSDHGNIEDMSHSGHTENPVATLIWGPMADRPAEGTLALTDLSPLIEGFLSPR